MNVKLRFLEKSDIHHLLQIENDPRYWHLSETIEPFTADELSKYIQNAKAPIESFGQLRFVIDVDNQFCGLIDLYEFDGENAGVGIIILDEFQKKGIAMKALELLKKYCIGELKMKTLFARIENDNVFSIKLFKKSFFKEKSHLKNYLEKNNELVDCKEYILNF